MILFFFFFFSPPLPMLSPFFHSATTMKFDQVNTLVCASLWPIIDCLLAPSPRVKQKIRLLRSLQKSQVSKHLPLITYFVWYLFNSCLTTLFMCCQLNNLIRFYSAFRNCYGIISGSQESPVCVQMMTSSLSLSDWCHYESLPLRSDWTLNIMNFYRQSFLLQSSLFSQI